MLEPGDRVDGDVGPGGPLEQVQQGLADGAIDADGDAEEAVA